MPAAVLSVERSGAICMSTCSHITNKKASAFVRTFTADDRRGYSYNTNMTRRGVPKKPPAWYLPEWMEVCGLSGRGSQARMMELTGWSRATMSQLYNGTQDISTPILEAAANALQVEAFELLMPPERAMALRQLRQSAATIVSAERETKEDVKRTGTGG